MEPKKRVTQEDIARTCKIDQGSVSRILNEDTRDSFAEETIQKVFKIARELGYLHPSLITSNRRESNRRKAELASFPPAGRGIDPQHGEAMAIELRPHLRGCLVIGKLQLDRLEPGGGRGAEALQKWPLGEQVSEVGGKTRHGGGPNRAGYIAKRS